MHPIRIGRTVKHVLLISLLLCLGATAHCQEKRAIKGIVLDSATFKRLAYVNIKVKNTVRGTFADSKGSFFLNVSIFDTLVFSMIGYKSYELLVTDWEPLLISLSEDPKVLDNVTVEGISLEQYYRNLFEDQHTELEDSRKRAPFFYSKSRKQKVYVKRFEDEYLRTKVYRDHVVASDELRNSLMRKHSLTLTQYYTILREFNERNHSFMYYLAAPELISLINAYFEKRANRIN